VSVAINVRRCSAPVPRGRRAGRPGCGCCGGWRSGGPNLVAEPKVTVELAEEFCEAVATPLAGTERDRVWAELKRLYPFFADHEAATTRTIPVVALTRAS
jgi:F420H(2)-dependent quinone reductase